MLSGAGRTYRDVAGWLTAATAAAVDGMAAVGVSDDAVNGGGVPLALAIIGS